MPFSDTGTNAPNASFSSKHLLQIPIFALLQTGIDLLLFVIEVDDKCIHYCNSNEQSKLNPIT